MPAVGFGVETPLGWWVFTGDTGPNPELWDVLAGQKIAQLVIETAFGDEEAYLAEISGAPVAADAGARTVAAGWRGECVHHATPSRGEVPAVLSQIRALDTRHVIEPLREGQRFHRRRWWTGGRCDGNGHLCGRVTFFGDAFRHMADSLGVGFEPHQAICVAEFTIVEVLRPGTPPAFKWSAAPVWGF